MTAVGAKAMVVVNVVEWSARRHAAVAAANVDFMVCI